MKRDRFSSYEAWAAGVLRGPHCDSSASLLVAEWQAAYGIVDCVRGCFVTVATHDGSDAFYLLSESDNVLAFARVDPDTKMPMVTFYHATHGPREYLAWRSRAKWGERPLPRISGTCLRAAC
jgi:hypothetical protein